MRTFIINLDSAKDRWAFVTRSFEGTGFGISRVSGVDGHALHLPIPEYSQILYRWFHGRPGSMGEIGCYLSHVKAMREFLATGDAHGLIAEDDLTLGPDFETVIAAALPHARRWNLLRLSGLGEGRSARIAQLTPDHSLRIGLGRLKGTGAYVIDRKAAHILATRLLPMRLPFDHAIDREWFFGLRAACVLPFPASQLDSGFRSSIQRGKSLKLPALRRHLTTHPYQAFNETSRLLFRTAQYLRARLDRTPGPV